MRSLDPETLANAMVELIEHDGISRDTIRRRLDDNDLKPWQKKMWCIAIIDGEYIARMEDLLDLHAEPHDPKRPVVCFDESPIQLIGEVRVPITPKPGKRYSYDSEYKRNGTANLFVTVDANRSRRKVEVTDQRANQDFAVRMRDWADVDYPDADKIRAVMDNLSTHTASAIYQTFPAAQARRIMRRLEFHYTPKHASWLNMAEIEIGVLRRQCLDRRIRLETEVRAWHRGSWTFDVRAGSARVAVGPRPGAAARAGGEGKAARARARAACRGGGGLPAPRSRCCRGRCARSAAPPGFGGSGPRAGARATGSR